MEFVKYGPRDFWWLVSATLTITVLIPFLLLILTKFIRNQGTVTFKHVILTLLWWKIRTFVCLPLFFILKSNRIFKSQTMELILYGVVSIIMWILAITILLPLMFVLKINKAVNDHFFAFMFTRFLRVLDEYYPLKPCRKKTFDLLKEHLADRDISKPLKILEIGIGAGENLEFYPENSLLTVLDVNANFFTFFRQNQKKYPNITYEGTITSFAEDMKDIEDSSFDLVVGTYVLCSVNNVDDVLKEVKRVLKPGGKYLFLEHVSFPRFTWNHAMQKFVAPLWITLGNGCDVLRFSGDNIKKAEFSHLIYEEMNFQQVLLILRPHVYGIAVK